MKKIIHETSDGYGNTAHVTGKKIENNQYSAGLKKKHVLDLRPKARSAAIKAKKGKTAK